MSSVDYVKGIIQNIELRMVKEGMRLPRRSETPMSYDYTPELDATIELELDGINMYQELIGELRQAIEIGRVGIGNEASVLPSQQAAPCGGHLQHIMHIFDFLKNNPKLTLYFDPSLAVIDPTSFTGSTAE